MREEGAEEMDFSPSGNTTSQKRNKITEPENGRPSGAFFNGFNSNSNIVQFGMPHAQSTNQIEFSSFRSPSSSVASNNFGRSLPSEQLQCYHDSIITSLKMEQNIALEKKNREVTQMKTLNNALSHHMEAMKKENGTLQDDNKLLKRAVGIQDNRNKELNTQNAQLQNVLQLAANHIAHLEEVNRNLQAQLQAAVCGSNSSGGYNYQPPPDLF